MNKSSAAKPITNPDPHARAILEILDADPRSLTQLAGKAGYSVALLSKLRRSHAGRLNTLRDLAAVVGYKFALVPYDTKLDGVFLDDAPSVERGKRQYAGAED